MTNELKNKIEESIKKGYEIAMTTESLDYTETLDEEGLWYYIKNAEDEEYGDWDIMIRDDMKLISMWRESK